MPTDNPRIRRPVRRTIADIDGTPMRHAISQTRNIYTDAVRRTAGAGAPTARQAVTRSRATTTARQDPAASARAQIASRGTVSRGNINALNRAVGIGGGQPRRPMRAPEVRSTPASSPSSPRIFDKGALPPKLTKKTKAALAREMKRRRYVRRGLPTT